MHKPFVYLLISGFFLAMLSFTCKANALSAPPKREVYELKIYHLESQEQEERIETFLRDAYLPALKRAGIKKVGVFKPIEEDPAHGKKIYVYIPYKSAEEFMKVPKTLEKDSEYKQAGRGYLQASHDNPPYQRIESVLLQAFSGMPQFRESKLNNPARERIYELRSYESATEELYRNKVQMFNQGEIDIFNRLGFNAVFYAEVIAGGQMPNLMYMTTHANKDAREENWKAFGDDAQWGQMSQMEEYQNNVSHIDIILLHPTTYSEI